MYVTPVFYTYMAQVQAWLKSRQRATAMEPAAAAK
jgi:hypothetical protein